MLRREAPVADVRQRILAALDASHDAAARGWAELATDLLTYAYRLALELLRARRHGERAFYRRATCVDTSGETADLIVPRLVRWAVDGLRMGAL